LDHALAFVLAQRAAHGRWKQQESLRGKTWDAIERKGEPSKWVTLRALGVLNALDLRG